MSIDALLYRPITQNSQFEGLIPPYQGHEISFDKESDNSTTYDTLKYMDRWATKYEHQMKAVAPRLKGRDLKETVAKIYQFLYSHFQYKLDGSLQNLYSPSAAWKFRKQGFDCKTYSILASTILRNLNIPHTFRMVQQAGIMPGEWSHVYVIVPENNTHYVIDATTHSNKEVSFTKKHDYSMIHRGLASPNPYGALGCACQGTAIKKNVGLGSPAVLSNTIANFQVFLNELEKKGFPREVTNKMLFLVKTNIENGIDPNFNEIVTKAIMPVSKLGEITPFTSYLTPSGSTFTSMPTTSYGSQPSYSNDASGGFMDGAMSALSNVSVGGVPVGGVASSISGLLTGNPMAAIGLITSLIPIEKTFGAVFANGFDLSCWGASYSEQKAKTDIELWLPYIQQWCGIYTKPSTENLDRFQFITAALLDQAVKGQASKYAACTRKGWALVQKGVEELRKNVYQEFVNNKFQLINAGKKSGATWKFALPNSPGTSLHATTSLLFDSYTVIPPQQQQQQVSQQQQQASQQVQYTTVQNPDGTTSQVPVAIDAAPESSSSTPLLLGGAALLAIKLLL